jgi:hypothetical protein
MRLVVGATFEASCIGRKFMGGRAYARRRNVESKPHRPYCDVGFVRSDCRLQIHLPLDAEGFSAFGTVLRPDGAPLTATVPGDTVLVEGEPVEVTYFHFAEEPCSAVPE